MFATIAKKRVALVIPYCPPWENLQRAIMFVTIEVRLESAQTMIKMKITQGIVRFEYESLDGALKKAPNVAIRKTISITS